MVLLVLLDLSSAFDTLDHHLLLTRLEYSCGITGSALAWLQSYISNRHQKVVVDGVASNDSVLTCGVPQGSVLGPILYCLYTRCIGDIITRHGLQYHCYADDIQIYVTIEPDSTLAAAKCEIEQCTNNISLWLQKNKLKLNKEKTEAILFHNKYQHAAVPAYLFLTIAGHRVTATSSVRDLGVVLDSTLSMQAHVGQVTKSCYYQLRNIGQIRRSINEGACKTLVHALVTSRIDYCNSLLYGLPQTVVQRLQRVQNCAARIVSRTKKYDHITPVLQKVHWLPTCLRPTYKTLVLTYTVLKGLAPNYLQELLKLRCPGRTLRSSSLSILNKPLSQTVTYGDRRFAVAAANCWNPLPNEVKNAESLGSFRRQLKTHLFKQAFLI